MPPSTSFIARGAVGAALAEEVDQRLGARAAHAGVATSGEREAELHQVVREAAWGSGRRSRRGRTRLRLPGGAQHAVEREVAERVDAEEARGSPRRVRRRDQLLAGRRVDAVVARAGDRRRAQPQVHLARARGPDHLRPAPCWWCRGRGCRPPRPPTCPAITSRTALNLIFTLATRTRLRRLDERAADVVVADQPVLELEAGLLGESERHGVRGVGHAEHHLGAGRRLLARQLAAELAARAVHRLAEDRAVGPGEVHQLEHAAAHRPGASRGRLGDPARPRSGRTRPARARRRRARPRGRARRSPRRRPSPSPSRPITSGRKPAGRRTA